MTGGTKVALAVVGVFVVAVGAAIVAFVISEAKFGEDFQRRKGLVSVSAALDPKCPFVGGDPGVRIVVRNDSELALNSVFYDLSVMHANGTKALTGGLDTFRVRVPAGETRTACSSVLNVNVDVRRGPVVFAAKPVSIDFDVASATK
jgi:hypothetical protein